jgi:hypothetical protein
MHHWLRAPDNALITKGNWIFERRQLISIFLFIPQSGEPSPTGSDWTSKSFADESGIGGMRWLLHERGLPAVGRSGTS